jgi:hypothetical protein
MKGVALAGGSTIASLKGCAQRGQCLEEDVCRAD